MRKINYDKNPSTLVKGFEQEIDRGYAKIAETLGKQFKPGKTIVVT